MAHPPVIGEDAVHDLDLTGPIAIVNDRPVPGVPEQTAVNFTLLPPLALRISWRHANGGAAIENAIFNDNRRIVTNAQAPPSRAVPLLLHLRIRLQLRNERRGGYLAPSDIDAPPFSVLSSPVDGSDDQVHKGMTPRQVKGHSAPGRSGSPCR
jgi:hypothetical protein